MPRSATPTRAVRAASWALIALAAVAPSVGDAQFAGVPRAPRTRPTRAEVTGPVRDTPYRDTLPPTRLPDMKAWVDSATISLSSGTQGGGGPQVTRPDSAAPAPRSPATTPPGRPPGAAARPDSMRNGAPAPDTATPLPTIALAGVVMVGAGLLLRRGGSSRSAATGARDGA